MRLLILVVCILLVIVGANCKKGNKRFLFDGDRSSSSSSEERRQTPRNLIFNYKTRILNVIDDDHNFGLFRKVWETFLGRLGNRTYL